MVMWHDYLSQASELVIDFRPGDHRTHDKFCDSNLDKGVNTASHRVRRAPGGVGLEGYAWATSALHQDRDLSADVLVAKVEGDDGSIMVLWDYALVFLGSLANGTHRLAGFLWR